ncbi:carbonic anhydrase [uncultured Desulfuromusa sp.]|uniref:carbonic anhydrase n=1 Tax=uncultured Desulfuromusa sp. TaxID=219183 RepID=UPI002AA6E871|nr:carbonic anhydrase [uncultured Desulfuromusa sp.]
MADVTKFLSGMEAFQQQHFGENRELATSLVKGQKPQALLIGCCDSRVDPALLMDCDLGDLFILRNIANLVPPYLKNDDYHGVSSSLEYAVCYLEVSDIIILGHSECGGIEALMATANGEEAGEFIGKWVNIAASARDKVLQEMPDESPARKARACEREAVLVSLKNLMTFPWVKERVSKGQLSLHGWYYNISTGQLKYYNQLTGEFEILVKRYAPGKPQAKEGPQIKK